MSLGPTDLNALTLRQLIWMVDGRDRQAWSIVSTLMALIANCHKDSKRKSFEPNDFNPTLTREEKNRDAILITDDNIELIRDEFKMALGDKERYEKIEEDE